MQVIPTKLPGVMLIEPKVFGDSRGYFIETYQQQRYETAGFCFPFVQDNMSFSTQGVLRGMHCQKPHAQGKLVSVIQGEVWDVALDVRYGSPTFGQWVGEYLSAENHRQLYVPPGFAHGFCVTGENALFSYKCTDTYHPQCELTFQWDDPDVAIAWPVKNPSISAKDQKGRRLKDYAPEELPAYNEYRAMAAG